MSKSKKIKSIAQHPQKLKIFMDALTGAYRFWVDELDCSKSTSRIKTDLSFSEVMGMSLNSAAHWTIIFRPKIFDDDIAHWEFGVNTMGEKSYFIWIQIREELAEVIFKKFNLEVYEH